MSSATTFDEIFGTHRGPGPGATLDDPQPSHQAYLQLDRLLHLVASGEVLAGLVELGTDNYRIEHAPLLRKLEGCVVETLVHELKDKWLLNIENFATSVCLPQDFLEQQVVVEELQEQIRDRLHLGRTQKVPVAKLLEFVTDYSLAATIRAAATLAQQSPNLFIKRSGKQLVSKGLTHEDWCDVFSPYLTENPIREHYLPEDVAMLRRAFLASLRKMRDFRAGRTKNCAACGRFRARFSESNSDSLGE